jgi:hypothetical protein
MAESQVFDWVSSQLEARTSLSRLEARGTLRLVLKDIGLDPNSVTLHQMSVVVQRLLAPALAKRRVETALELCAQLAAELSDQARTSTDTGADRESAYDVFERLDAGRDRRFPR